MNVLVGQNAVFFVKPGDIYKKTGQCRYNVILRGVRATLVAVEKQ
jgi:hypothetical protein